MLVIPNGFIHRHARQYNEGRGCKDVFNACCLICFSVTLITIGSTLVIVGYTTYITPDSQQEPVVPEQNLTLSGFVLLGVGLLLMVSTIIYKSCSRKEYLKENESPGQLEAAHPLQGTGSTELPEIPVWINVSSPLEQHFLRGQGHRHGLSLNRQQFLAPSRFDKTVNGQLVTHSAVFGQVPKPRLAGLY